MEDQKRKARRADRIVYVILILAVLLGCCAAAVFVVAVRAEDVPHTVYLPMMNKRCLKDCSCADDWLERRE